jgi:F-type H+-transporting ATPase subunit b
MTCPDCLAGSLPPAVDLSASRSRTSSSRCTWKAWIGAALLAIAVTAPVIAAPAFQQPAHEAQASSEHEAEGGGVVSMIAKLFNFAVLAGVLVYFLRTPIAAYLAARGTQIRQELVTAAAMRAEASAQLVDIRRKQQSLPAELEALTQRGAEDLRAEQARIAETARTERDRLLEQTRREIEMRLRIARRQITEYAAQLTIDLAEQRIKRSITPDDQLRLVDRYTAHLKEAR